MKSLLITLEFVLIKGVGQNTQESLRRGQSPEKQESELLAHPIIPGNEMCVLEINKLQGLLNMI